ncbi:serine hydrolase domain-containing protein [Actinosynnema sp. NPDC047251]|nr:serine hydrolase domain-containing protein [Saccharothrix espanaensis]
MKTTGVGMRPGDWPEVLADVDRQATWLRRSPDRMGLAGLMRLYDVPAVSIAVRQDGAEPWAGAYGVPFTGSADVVGPGTIFQACSISKHVAAFGALRLVDQGVLDLDEDVDAYLRSWRLPDSDGWRPTVTLRHLLAHTAGLSYNWFRGFGQDEPLPTITEVLHGQPPATSPPVRPTMVPGTAFRYSGSHYAVLQQLLEDVTGTGFADLVRSLVLDPLGLVDSSFDQDFPHRRGDVAHGHHVDGTPLRGGWRVQPELAGAGLWTTPADLTRLATELAHARTGDSALLSRELAVDATTPQVPGGYGLGTRVYDDGRFGHTGGNVGYSCWLATWPSSGTSMAVMLANDGADEVLWTLLTAAREVYDTPPVRAGAVDPVGEYRAWDGCTVTITDDAGALALQVPGQPPLPLHALPNGDWRTAALDGELTVRERGGEVVLELRQQDTVLTATRPLVRGATLEAAADVAADVAEGGA